MPQMGPMVGYAVTVQIQPGNPEHVENNPNAWSEYREYIASIDGPKIIVVQDLDKPKYQKPVAYEEDSDNIFVSVFDHHIYFFSRVNRCPE